jgi:hypothetical protein
MHRKIIAFAAQMQVGKTTSAKYLVTKYDFVRDNFAFSLKTGIGKHVFGLTDEQLNDPILKETIDPYWDMTPRKIMQVAGTEAMRNTFHKDIWIKTLEKRIKAPTWENANWAIDDVRYPNEADAIKSWGGIVVLILRGEEKSIGHLSETSMQSYKDFDYTIDNNGTFTGLYNQLDKLVRTHNWK